jgi:hypothetical protein
MTTGEDKITEVFTAASPISTGGILTRIGGRAWTMRRQAIPTNATTGPDPIADTSDPPTTRPQRRWTTVLLGASGILVLVVLVAAVITMSNASSHPAEQAPPTAPAPTSTSAVTTIPVASAPPALPPPTSWSVTATASTLATPPPPMHPGAPKPEPDVRQRLHDLFPRLFPGP